MMPLMGGSLQTTITADINQTDTRLDVADIAAFPDVGSTNNRVTIWSSKAVWEVCKYTAKVATTNGAGYLTIVRSGDDHSSSSSGTALSWTAGAKAARNVNKRDFDVLQANIGDHETRLGSAENAITGKEPANSNIQAHIDSISNPHAEPRKNLIINGEFSIAQRGTSYTSSTWRPNSDDSYLLDRWLLLSDGNDIVDVSQDTLKFARSRYALKAEVETSNKKFGFCQIIEANSCIPLRGQNVSLSVAAKTATNKIINNIRVAVLEWTGAADAVISDVVSAWGNQGTTPTWAASWAVLNTPANLTLSTSEQTFKVENLTVGGSCNNLAVFVWVDDTDAAVDDLLYLGEIQMVNASTVGYFIHEDHFAECIRRCQIYTPENVVGTGQNNTIIAIGGIQSTTKAYPVIHHPDMAYPPSGTFVGSFSISSFALGAQCTGISISTTNSGSSRTTLECTYATQSGYSAGQFCLLASGSASSFIVLEAEL